MSKTKFTLVHGTFAANADWVNQSAEQNSSGFRAKLETKFAQPIEFSIPPAWGSRGLLKLKDLTNAARLTGAQRLQTHIRDHDSKAGHFLIAHSHGGNVAMYALQDKEVTNKIDGLICLATPFLYPRKRPLSITALVLSLAIMITGILQFLWSAQLLQQDWPSWLGAACLLMFGVVAPACLTWLVIFERYQYKNKGDSRLHNLIDQLSYSNPGLPILLVRASGDEATGLLRGAQFLNWLGGIGMRLGGRQIYLLICATAFTLFWVTYGGSDVAPSFVIPLLKQGLILSAAIMVVLLMALTVSRIFVGFDAWRWVGEIETMVEDGPPGITSDLVVIKPKSADIGLSHTSIYTQDETIDSIASWCAEVMQTRQT